MVPMPTFGICPGCKVGKLKAKIGSYGNFIGCTDFPDCKFII